ncbi:MAG: WD40/YVTN/BNR-like repeat-containing protein [Gemmatimonadota bacterium]
MNRRSPHRGALCLAALLSVLTFTEDLRGQSPAPATIDTNAFAALTWRSLGPARGGRSVAVAGSDKRPLEYWMGTTGGGVFKTTDGGITWAPVSDRFFGGTIGAIAVSESNPDIVYVGTGEYPIRGNVSHGDGVYRTDDGGKTWRYLGLVETRQISRVRVHPKNPDVVYVGALGHVWGPNPERGVYRSVDGGKTWKKILFRNDSTGVSDLVLDPSDPRVIYAAFWQAGRKPWQLISGGAGSGIFKSTDGGDTWKEITRNPGLPKGLLGNIGLAVSPANPKIVWALIEADSGGVFRSADGGETWTRVNDERKLRQRAWYYSKIYADPKDTNVVYASNVQFQKSTDGGRTWRNIRTPHGDSHDLWISSTDPLRMIEANDGGANVSVNGGRSWTSQEYATGQFYHVTTTTHFPYRVCGAQQDNSTLCGPSRGDGEWYDAGGGESGYIQVRPDNPDIMYAGSYGGYLTRKDARTGLARNINPWPMNPMGHSAGDLKYRFQWTFPILISPHDPNTLYVGANVLFKTTDDGTTFVPISGDLTRNDPRTLGPSGGPITKDQTSVEYYGTIFAIAESPKQQGVIWTGSDDGLVHVSRDGGATWRNVTPPDMKEWTRVSIIDASPHDPGTAYVAANRYQLDDMAPYIWKTTDYGATWTRIDKGITRTEFVRVVREDPKRKGLLFAGTERGVWVSFDDGGHWQKLQRNLPPVAINDLVVKDNDVVIATLGRGFWVMDDISPLREISAEVTKKPRHLFQPADAYRVQWGGGFAAMMGGGSGGAPSGAVIHYWLARPGQEVTLEFLDAKGNVIRSISSKQDSATAADSLRNVAKERARLDSLAALGVMPASVAKPAAGGPGEVDFEALLRRGAPAPRAPNKAGLNRFVWNLRYPDASRFDNMILWAASTQGPMVVPGTYSVRIKVGEATETKTFTVLKDPRTSATQADLEEQFALLMKIRDRTSEANDAVKTIRNVKQQLAERKAKLTGARAQAFARAADALAGRLSAIEGEIYQVKNRSGQDPLNYPIKLNNKIAALAGVVASTEARPTRQSYAVFEELSAALDRQLGLLKAALADLAPRNEQLKAAGLEAIVPVPVWSEPDSGGAADGLTAEQAQDLWEVMQKAEHKRW